MRTKPWPKSLSVRFLQYKTVPTDPEARRKLYATAIGQSYWFQGALKWQIWAKNLGG